MRETERAMRKDISDGVDCVAAATRLMLQRAELTQLVAERRTLGDLTPIGLPDLRKARPAARRASAPDFLAARLRRTQSA